MKKTIYTLTETRRGDSYSEYSFVLKTLKDKVLADYNHLSEHDKKNTEELYIEGYEITIPDEYADISADELLQLIEDDEIDCPEYDACCGIFNDNAEVYCEDLLND